MKKIHPFTRRMAWCMTFITFACATAFAAELADGPTALRAKLAEDVKSLAVRKGALPGDVIAAGSQTVPLAFGKSSGTEMTVAAASTFGNGRVVAVSHTAFFCPETADDAQNAAFLRHCLTWLSHGNAPQMVAVDAKNADQDAAIKKALPGVTIGYLNVGYKALAELPAGTLLVTTPDSHPLEEAHLLTDFVRRGGNVFCSVVGWGWHQITKKDFDKESPFNTAFGPVGLFTSDLTVGPSNGDRYEVAKAEGLPGTVAEDALGMIEDAKSPISGNVSSRSVLTLGELVSALPPDDERWRPRLEKLCNGTSGLIPTPKHPLKAKNPRERIGLILHQKAWLANPERNWPAHPAAATYPGLPAANTPRVTRSIDVDLSVPYWHGTGLFAVAGEPLTITLPEEALNLKLMVRVGTTTCNLNSHASWSRAPVTSVEISLNKRTTTFASPFGGLVYIVVPHYVKVPKGASVKVTVGPACPAAWYVEGRDTPETWKKSLETCPAPFAEIESDVIALTVQRSEASKVADPQNTLSILRQVLANDAWLTGLPVKRPYAERMCADVQLCAGYMHSGYPVMLPMHTIKHLLNADTLRKGDVDEVWGFFHELGHNHQNYDWVFDGSVEVSVNLFSLYNMEKICGKTARETEKMGNAYVRRSVERWKASGRSFEQWKNDPFLALDFFVELQQKYGWESFHKVFSEYRTLKDSERPKTDADKRRQLCERYSRVVGKDLTPEFSFMLEPEAKQGSKR